MTALVAVLIVLAVELFAIGGIVLYRLGRRAGAGISRDDGFNDPGVTDDTEVVAVAFRPDPDPDHEPESSWMRGLVMETVIVHTTTGLSYEGLLALEHEKGLILRNPLLLDDQRSPTPMAGELWLAKEKIEGVQTKPVELTKLPQAS